MSRAATHHHGQTARDDPPLTYRGAGATYATTDGGASNAQGTLERSGRMPSIVYATVSLIVTHR